MIEIGEVLLHYNSKVKVIALYSGKASIMDVHTGKREHEIPVESLKEPKNIPIISVEECEKARKALEEKKADDSKRLYESYTKLLLKQKNEHIKKINTGLIHNFTYVIQFSIDKGNPERIEAHKNYINLLISELNLAGHDCCLDQNEGFEQIHFFIKRKKQNV